MVADGQRRRQRRAADPGRARRPGWKDDLPRLVVGSLGRQQRRRLADDDRQPVGRRWRSRSSRRASKSTPVVGRDRVQHRLAAPAAPAPSAAASSTGRSRPPAAQCDLPWPAAAGDACASSTSGAGKPWLTVQSLAAIPLEGAVRAGYAITRSVSAVEQQGRRPLVARRRLRVRLEVDAAGDMTWVVVSDPVPGGATILGSGLGRDSAIATPRRAARGQRPGRPSRSAASRPSAATTRSCRAASTSIEYTCASNNPGRSRCRRRGSRRCMRRRPSARRRMRRSRSGRDRARCMRRAGVALLAVAAERVRRAHGAADLRRGASAAHRPSDVTLLDRHGAPVQTRARRQDGAPPGVGAARTRCRRRCCTAIVLSEDRRFYEHSGVDWAAVARSAWANLWNTRTRGASTLTMQLAGLLDDGLARPARRAQRRPEARPGADRDAARGALEEERDPRGLPERGAVSRRDRRHRRACRRRCSASMPSGLDAQEAAVAAALRARPERDAGRRRASAPAAC